MTSTGWGYLDSTFKKLIPPIAKHAWPFTQDSLAKVEFSSGLSNSYLLKSNGKLIDLKYKKLGFPSEGLIAAKYKNKWGYVNFNGDIIIPFQYKMAYDFHDGIAMVEYNNRIGYINKSSEWVIQPILRYGTNSQNGFILSQRVIGNWVFFSKSGTQLTEKTYLNAKPFEKIMD